VVSGDDLLCQKCTYVLDGFIMSVFGVFECEIKFCETAGLKGS